MRLGKRNGAQKSGQSKLARTGKGAPPQASDPAVAKLAAALNEREQLREQQAATAKILNVIASSPSDVQPVFDTIARSAVSLCGALFSSVYRFDGRELHFAAHHNFPRAALEMAKKTYPKAPDRSQGAGRAILTKAVVRIEDVLLDADYRRVYGKRGGWRRVLSVPMMRSGTPVGTISVAWAEPGPVADEQVALLKTFADQAVIAIENVRLFNETKEALEQQTATSEVLGVISRSPTDLQPVFDAILKSATELCEAHLGLLNLYEGDRARTVAQRGGSAAFAKWAFERGEFKPDGEVMLRMIAKRRPAQAADITQGAAYLERRPNTTSFADLGGVRTFLAVPLVKDGRVVGNIGIYRPEVRPFTDKQIALVSTFANQAVIAIENVRLFNETKEALERQTATADILGVIAASPSDVQPVFDAIVKHAAGMAVGSSVNVSRLIGDQVHLAAYTRVSASADELLLRLYPFPIASAPAIEEAIRTRLPSFVADFKNDPRITPKSRAVMRARGFRSTLYVPIVRGERVYGLMHVSKIEPGPFPQKWIELLKIFADQAVIAIENARLFNETKEALEQQTATAQILRVISSSPSDMRPVFDSILEHAMRLCDAGLGTVGLYDGKTYQHRAQRGGSPEYVKRLFDEPFVPGAQGTLGRMIAEQRPVHIPDYRELPAYREREPRAVATVELGGARTYLAVPMLKDGQVVGGITIRRAEVRPFTQKQIDLVSTFANQAVIAIENARLFNETKEALEQQTASSEVLEVISKSPSDLGPVFEAILRSATRLCDAHLAMLNLYDGERYRTVAQRSANPDFSKWVMDRGPYTPDPRSALARVAREREPIQLLDMRDSPAFRAGEMHVTKFVEVAGARTYLVVPLLKDGNFLGAIAIYRQEVRAFTGKQIKLVETFARQAVIAMENVRLFNETKEALERQTATSEVLKTISRSTFDLNAVLQVLIENATRLAGANQGFIFRFDGEVARLAYSYNAAPAYRDMIEARPLAPGRGSLVGRVLLEHRPVHIPDALSDPEFTLHDAQRAGGFRSMLGVPMMREGKLIGVIAMWANEVKPFTEKQIELVSTFADQAVIAIENVRLFNETKEALEQQTATSEVLGVISRSPTDVSPVFDAVLKRATQLCEAHLGLLNVYDGEKFLNVALHGATPEFATYVTERGWYRSEGALERVAAELRPVHIADLLESPWYRVGKPNSVKMADLTGARTYLGVPLLKEGRLIGAIVIYRREVRPFTEKQIALVSTFANQAVIAIENARLFNETKEALERQTATAEILKVISGSPTDEKPVFDAIVASAARLFGRTARIRLLEDGRLILRAISDGSITDKALDEPLPLNRDSLGGRVALDRAAFQIPDTMAPDAPASARKWAERGGYRAMAAAPLMRESAVLGVISVTSAEPGALAEKQMALLRTFADQAVIAIENVRLFNETKEALEQQTAISEVLRVISSSPSDVKPVLDAVAVRAARICDASDARVFLIEGERLRYTAGFGDVPMKVTLGETLEITRGGAQGRAIIDRETVHVEDMQAQSENEYPMGRAAAERGGYHTVLAVPLLREQRPLGTIILRRREVKPFSEKQIALLKTFADQAAIAIENVRLFNATQEALEQQTATTEVLNVISSSVTDARPVFDAIARSVLKLYGARNVGLAVRAGETIDRVGYAVSDASADDGTQALYPIPLDERSLSGRAILRGEVVHIRDVETEEGLSEHSRAITRKTGVRSVLVAPMFSMGAATGALAIARRSPGGFSEREVEMVRTFADQAVIAMENVRLFREIEDKSAQLEVANKHKSEFLASMSHELRTPLNALLGFNEMLLGDVYGEVPGEMKPPLAQMQASGKHLLRLINNVLDLAKIEAGRMDLALADYSVHDTVESVRSTLQPLATDKGLQFLASVPADIPLAYGDPGRIAQCLMNLAGNSLKFTKAGKVEISVAVDNGLLRYRVADTGIGIAPDKMAGLFTEFKQTDATIASEYGGTGLGLSISKKFVEMHGGRIWAESEPGRGSTFIFEVPLHVQAGKAA